MARSARRRRSRPTRGPDALAVDPTGTRLYVAGSYDNTVALHAIAADGTVEPVGATVSGPANPTGVALDGSALFVVGWDSSNVLSYGVDPDSGALALVGSSATGINPGTVAVDPAEPLHRDLDVHGRGRLGSTRSAPTAA